MNYHRYFGPPGAPVETCLVGSGSFGRSFLAQGRKVPRMRARVEARKSPVICRFPADRRALLVARQARPSTISMIPVA